MLTDPRAALAEQHTVATALVGLAGLAGTIRALARSTTPSPAPTEPADDLVHLLLAVVSLGEAATRLAAPPPADPPSTPPQAARPAAGKWLR